MLANIAPILELLVNRHLSMFRLRIDYFYVANTRKKSHITTSKKQNTLQIPTPGRIHGKNKIRKSNRNRRRRIRPRSRRGSKSLHAARARCSASRRPTEETRSQARPKTKHEKIDMTKFQLIEKVASENNITSVRAENVVSCVFNAMTETLKQGDGVEIRGFGSFTVRDYPPYTGRNPRTGETVHVSSKRLPYFKVGKELKEMVNGDSALGSSDSSD